MKLNDKYLNSFLLYIEINAKKIATYKRKVADKYAFWKRANNYCLFCENYSRINLPHGTLLTISKSYLKKGVPTNNSPLEKI